MGNNCRYQRVNGCIKTKIETAASVENKLLNPESEEVKTLWDSLIYQMLTQEDFYTKEAIIQSLQAVNYYVKFFQIEEENEDKKSTTSENSLCKSCDS